MQEYILDRRGRYEENVIEAQKVWLHLSKKGYGDDELIEKPATSIKDKDGNAYTLNESVTGGSDD